VKRLPGLRVPGAFDGFELAVRAVLGQQVSVKAATTMAGRWAAAFGEPITTSWPELCRLAPTAARMLEVAEHEIGALGVVGSRARCLMALARAVTDRRVVLSFTANVEEQIRNLIELPGIGPWTAQYIAMRALHWPDAFPDGDLMLLRAAGPKRKELLARAEAWRPWRAYATHYLWRTLGIHP
jgi:AraC family transcriptional regulator of adaptative response / DNA-3-methyladenine glycosylase II